MVDQSDTKDLLTKTQNWLSHQHDLVLGIVFGSLLTNRFNSQSDVDIAVLSQRPLSIDRRIELTQSLEKLLNRNVDMVDLGSSSGLIVKEALTTGTRLLNKDPDLFAARLLKFYLNESDYGPMRNRAYKERRDRVFGTKS